MPLCLCEAPGGSAAALRGAVGLRGAPSAALAVGGQQAPSLGSRPMVWMVGWGQLES